MGNVVKAVKAYIVEQRVEKALADLRIRKAQERKALRLANIALAAAFTSCAVSVVTAILRLS
jgi:hypothetical protein